MFLNDFKKHEREDYRRVYFLFEIGLYIYIQTNLLIILHILKLF